VYKKTTQETAQRRRTQKARASPLWDGIMLLLLLLLLLAFIYWFFFTTTL